MERRKVLIGAVYPLLGAFMPARAEQGGSSSTFPSSADGRVQVPAVDAKTRKRLSKAHVFVLSEASERLADAWSGDDGIAMLPNLAEELKAKYLLVECPWYFITGREWVSGQREYYMPLMALIPPGFSG